MIKNFFKVTFGLSLISILLLACQKELKETSISRQVQHDKKFSQPSIPSLLTSDLEVSFGSTIGPGGDLFVPDAQAGIIYRIDPKTGDKSIFASGLPQMIPEIGIGGVTDVVFIGGTAYALVTLVDDPGFPTGQINGIYRIDGPNSFEVIANLGAFNLVHPPTGFEFDVPTGVLYSIETFHGSFLVTDGHLNRVLRITLGGEITLVKQFNDIVPTGQAVKGNKVYIAQAGPAPHVPEDGKVVSLDGKFSTVTHVASGAPLLVDVEFGRGQLLFALSQGVFGGGVDGSPALPNTGSLVRVNADGTFSIVADEINIPTSFEIIGNTAYIVTLGGEVWSIDNIAGPPYGRPH